MMFPSREGGSLLDAGPRCGDCEARLAPSDRQLCALCAEALAAVERGSSKEAEKEWRARQAKLPEQGAAYFARVRAVCIRDGRLLLAARRPIRHWMQRRYGELLQAQGPYALISVREGAAALSDPRREE